MTRAKSLLRWGALACLSLPALSLPAKAAEPAEIKVGDPAVDGSFIKAYKNGWKITQYTPTGQSVEGGTWTDEVQIVDDHGRSAIKRIQVKKGLKNSYTSINVVDHKTLAPISTELTEVTGYHCKIDFNGTHVTADHTGTFPGDPTPPQGKTELTLATPAFDFAGGLFGLLFASLPLHEGYTGKFPSFVDEGDKIDSQTFTVLGKQTVPAGPGKQAETWKVRTVLGGFTMDFFVTKEPPYVIRLEQTGPRGGRAVFDMM
jgi:hypothetical protein